MSFNEDPSRWDRIVALHNQVADLEPGERARRLAECGDAPEVVAEVRSLLAVEAGAGSPIDKPVGNLAEVAASDLEETEADPEQVGLYRVVRRIGTGGMGVILLAERADGSFDKQVAIKLIKRGMDSEALLKRFHAERQILASLEHPAIARLIDAGISEDGRPYFVLEYIEGALPIDEYCRQHKLSISERLGLFRQACDAAHSAHQQLVLHRDLKPSNLLVSKGGDLKLLDFGIAKLMSPTSADGGELADATMTVHRMMTPAYASPEQVAGEPVGTYSDVYSLGVVLFELLTGSSPPRRGQRNQARDAPSPRPSIALTTHETAAREGWPGHDLARVHSELSGDLDAIVMQCLEGDVRQRYASAQALAEDLGRYLEGRPVLAQPPTIAYQLRKLIGRNPVASGLALLAALTLMLGAAGILWQSRVARGERDRATAEAAKATQVTGALISLFDMSDPALAADANEVSLRAVIERTETKIAEGLSEQPVVRAKMLSVLGRINTDMARYDVADEQLTEAVAILTPLFPDGHSDQVEALRYLSRLRGFQERPEEALLLAGEAVSMQRAIGGNETRLADTLVRFAKINMHTGRLDEAEAALLEALELRRGALGNDHDGVGEVMGVLAFVEYYRGRYTKAVELATQAVEIRTKALGPVHQGVGNELENLGAFLHAAGDRKRAREALLEALETRLAVFGSQHPYVAFSYTDLGSLAQAEGDLETALEFQRAALALRQSTYPPAHRLVRTVAASTADVLTEMNRAQEAIDLLEPILEAEKGPEAPYPAARASLLRAHGRALLALGEASQAEARLRDAAQGMRDFYGENHDQTASYRVEHARSLLALGRIDGAEEQNELALKLLRQLELPRLREVSALELRADIYHARGDLEAAETAQQEWLAVLTGELGPDSQRVVDARASLSSRR